MRNSLTFAIPLVLASCGGSNGGDAGGSHFLAGAQVIAGEPSCDDCSIDLQLLTDLGEARDKDVLSNDLSSLINTTSGVLVTSSEPGRPLLFAMDGRLDRALGEPDYFIKPTLMRKSAEDSIYVLDVFAKRIAVLSPQLVVARSFPYSGAAHDMVLLQDGSILVVAPRPSGDSINPFVRLSAITGDTLPAPAARLKPPRRAGPDFAERAIALARDGQHFWSAHALRYAIEKRALDGTLVRTLERDIGWFRPSIAVAGVSADTAPTARVVAIWEDTRGMLWVHTITADGRWPSALGELPGVDGKPRYYVASRDLYFDTRIEIIDPENGRLIATAKYDSELPTFTPGPYLSRVLKGPSGWLVGEVWSVRLVGNR